MEPVTRDELHRLLEELPEQRLPEAWQFLKEILPACWPRLHRLRFLPVGIAGPALVALVRPGLQNLAPLGDAV